MKTKIAHVFSFLALSLQLAAPCTAREAMHELTIPQKRGATYDEVRSRQALGRIVVAPNASYFLYEWSRPYSWAPDAGRLPLAEQARPQTFLYLVAIQESWNATTQPISEAVFPPTPGATYYLGYLSPDAKRLSFYELDRDDNTVKAGVVELTESSPRKVVFMSLPTDETRLEQLPVWLSNDEVSYPVKKNQRARANAISGKAELCGDCAGKMASVQMPSTAVSQATLSQPEPKLSLEAKPIARSADGSLVVYAIDTPEMLSLFLTKNGRRADLFENTRKIANSQ